MSLSSVARLPLPLAGCLIGGMIPHTALAMEELTARGPTAIAASATVATLLLVGWIALIVWLRAVILGRLKNLALERTRQISSASLRRISTKRLLQAVVIGTRLGSIALLVGGAFAWVTAVLDLIPDTHPLAVQIEGEVMREMQQLAFGAVRAVPELAVVALIFFAARMLHEFLNHYFRSISSGEASSTLFDSVTAETTRRLADIGIWIAAIIIAFPYIPGSDSAAFRGVTVLAGLMLSLGSANLVGQFASGLTLIYGRALRPGEYIQVAEAEGTIEHIGLFACTMRSPRDEIIVLPHTAVAAGLKNYSRDASRVRLTTTVTIGYDTPWRTVRDLLLAAAAATPGIRAEPAPVVRQAGLQDFYVAYELMFTPEHVAQRSSLLGLLHASIQDQFHAAGVQIMSPHYRADPAAPKVPPGRPGP